MKWDAISHKFTGEYVILSKKAFGRSLYQYLSRGEKQGLGPRNDVLTTCIAKRSARQRF